jgi:hypothetical protein
MTFLNRLTPEQKDTLISLPYRVGLWVSQADASGGTESDAREQQALSAILHGFAEEMFGSETMQHIISGTLAAKDRWPAWAERVDNVPRDCEFAMDLIVEFADAKDAAVFRNHLMEIGEAIALAFREDTQASFVQTIKDFIAFTLSAPKTKSAGSRRTFSEFLRISPSERKALITIAQALGTTY